MEYKLDVSIIMQPVSVILDAMSDRDYSVKGKTLMCQRHKSKRTNFLKKLFKQGYGYKF